MPDEKISDLPATALVNADDTMEKSNHNTSPSQRMTAAQLATFIETALTLLKLTGLKIQLNADGSAIFADNKILFNADGSCSFASANAAFSAAGALDLPLTHLLADGSAQFANGVTTISTTGDISIASANPATLSLNGGNISSEDGTSFTFGVGIHMDGTLPISSTNYSFNGDGSAIFLAGFITIDGSGISLNTTNTILPLDGSARFANGGCTIASTGDIEVTDNTQGVILKSPNGTRYRIVVSNLGVLSTVAA